MSSMSVCSTTGPWVNSTGRSNMAPTKINEFVSSVDSLSAASTLESRQVLEWCAN